jgi:uncharacterized membrane protein YphA (DoxX/SURF4 family)
MQRQKRADPTDILLLLVLLFFLAVSFVVAGFMNSKIQDVISNTALNSSSAYESINDSFNNINTTGVQRGFVLFFALLVIGIMVSSFMIRVHPVFIFIYIITLVVAIFLAIYLANTYAMLQDNPLFAELSANNTLITWTMQHIIKILIGVGALSMIIIFGKVGGGGSTSSDI